MEGILSNTGKQRMRFGALDPKEAESKTDIKKATASWVTGKTSKPPSVLERVAIREGQADLALPSKNDPDWDKDEMWEIIDDYLSYPSS